MKIFIADDHPIIRDGLTQIIESQLDMKVVAQAKDADQTVELAHQVDWDVAVIDYSMPGADGGELIRRLKGQHPHRPVIVLSFHPEETHGLEAIKAGASGYVNKENTADEIIAAIRKVASGKKHVGPKLAEKMAMELAQGEARRADDILSERERYVLPLLAQGMKVKEIGQELSLRPNTISTYRLRILRKLGLKNNIELVRYVIKTQAAKDIERAQPIGERTRSPLNAAPLAELPLLVGRQSLGKSRIPV